MLLISNKEINRLLSKEITNIYATITKLWRDGPPYFKVINEVEKTFNLS